MKAICDRIVNRCRSYLLLSAAGCLAGGITAATVLPSSLPWLASSTISALTAVWLLIKNRGTAAAAAICLGVFLLGGALADLQNKRLTAGDHFSRAVPPGTEVVVIGTLAEMATGSPEMSRARVQVHYYRTADHSQFNQTSGNLLLTLRGQWPRQLPPGSGLSARVIVEQPSQPTVPGGFDYRRHLAARGIYRTGFLHAPLLLRATALEPLAPSFSYLHEQARDHIAARLNELLPVEAAALYRAILLGDKSLIAEPMLDAFRKSGTLHILAISGLHLALLGLFLYTVFLNLLKCSETLMLRTDIRKVALLCCLPILLFYTLLAGANPPVLRSFIMAVLAIVTVFLNRSRSPLSIIGAAVLIMLAANPAALFSASFQLSFAAVAAIVIISPRLQSGARNLIELLPLPRSAAAMVTKTTLLITVTVAATLGTAPILLYHFNQISTVGVPANLIIEPLLCFWTLPLGFAAVAMLPASPVAAWLLKLGAAGGTAATETAVWLAEMNYSSVYLPSPSPWTMICYYAGLLLVLAGTGKPVRKFGVALFSLAALLMILPATGLTSRFRDHSTISFIDVGQGSSSLLELQNGQTVLIDGGARSAPGFDCGSRIIAPYLWWRGVGRLDDIVLTHADADHYNGLVSLLERFRPKRLWLPVVGSASPGYRLLLDKAKGRGIALIHPDTGALISTGETRLAVIDAATAVPGLAGAATASGGSRNDLGLILKLETPALRFLFPGDISSDREQGLTDKQLPLEAEVLLSPHHGSLTSNSLPFLEAVHPQYLVVSAGRHSAPLFPAPETRKRALLVGARLLSTAEHGTITFSLTRHGALLELHRPSLIASIPGRTARGRGDS